MLEVVNIKQEKTGNKATGKIGQTRSSKKENKKVSSLKNTRKRVKTAGKKKGTKKRRVEEKSVGKETNSNGSEVYAEKAKNLKQDQAMMKPREEVTDDDHNFSSRSNGASDDVIQDATSNTSQVRSQNGTSDDVIQDTTSNTSEVRSQRLQKMIDDEAAYFDPEDFASRLEGQKFDFDACSGVELYLEILSRTKYEATMQNFAVNQRLMNYVKNEYKNSDIMKSEEARSKMFGEIFESVFLKKENLNEKQRK